MDEVNLSPELIHGAIDAIATWLIVAIMRALAPGFWAALGSRRQRLILVAVVAVSSAVVSGLVAGMGWAAIGKLALVAFAGSVAARQSTKTDAPDIYVPSPGRSSSIISPMPDPPYRSKPPVEMQ